MDVAETPTHQPNLFALLVQSIKDYAIFALDREGHVVTWNDGAKAIKGYDKEEIIGKHFSIFYPPEALQSGWPSRELALAEKEGRFADEGWRVRKDGTQFWASVFITALHNSSGDLTGFAKVTRDLTEKRRMEEKVQALNKELRSRVQQLDEYRRLVELRTVELQNLSARLLRVQDDERRRIARDLHDDIGQQLVSLKMVLTSNADPEALKMIDSALLSVRSLSHLLHPPLLDETGLVSALHWFVDGMVKRSGIQISLVVKPQTFPRLSQDIETAIFRVVQESLTNVYKHADSESARVDVELQQDWVVLRIRDYGKGFTPTVEGTSERLPTLGVGIAGMRERLRQLGGDLTVSRAQPGTLVEARIAVV